MATAQVSSAPAPLGRKRSRDAAHAAAEPVTSLAAGASSKRRCRAPATVDAALRHFDGAAPALYAARRDALARTGASDAVFARLLAGLDGDVRAFLRIVDANVARAGVEGVLEDCRVRGVDLARIGVRAHSFCVGDKAEVLAAYGGFYGEERWPRDVASFVAKDVLGDERRVGIVVLSGGGVRDVLMADFCRAYGITARRVPMHLVVVTGESGKSFMVPFVPGSCKQW